MQILRHGSSFPRAPPCYPFIDKKMPPAGEYKGPGYDVMSLSRGGDPHIIPRFFAPDPRARMRMGVLVPWLPVRQLERVLGVGRKAMARAIIRTGKVEDFGPRNAGPDEVTFLHSAGFMSKFTTEAPLVTVPHALSIFTGRSGVTAGLMRKLKALASRPPSDDPPTATEIRELRERALQRVRLIPSGAAGGGRIAELEGPLHLREVGLTGHYGLTRDDVASSPRLSREMAALEEFYRSRINLERPSRALAEMTVNNILGATRSFLGYTSKARQASPSLASCLDGEAIHAYLRFLSDRAAERTGGAAVASPMTEVHLSFIFFSFTTFRIFHF